MGRAWQTRRIVVPNCSSCVKPSTAFSGVRSSWLMRARTATWPGWSVRPLPWFRARPAPARVGDVPVDADTPQRAALGVGEGDRARGQPAHAAVGQADAELVLAPPACRPRRRGWRPACARGRRDAPARGARGATAAALPVPARAGGTSARPSARCRSRNPSPRCRCRRCARPARRVFVGAAQRLLGEAALGDVDGDAEYQPAALDLLRPRG